jgi:hypothetical protein
MIRAALQGLSAFLRLPTLLPSHALGYRVLTCFASLALRHCWNEDG